MPFAGLLGLCAALNAWIDSEKPSKPIEDDGHRDVVDSDF
jgi:hypothetical protein